MDKARSPGCGPTADHVNSRMKFARGAVMPTHHLRSRELASANDTRSRATVGTRSDCRAALSTRSGRRSDRRIRRASMAWQFARRRAPIVRFCPARLLAALTPAQANLAGDSTFFRLRMGRQGRWPNAWAAGGGTARGRSSLGQWSSRAVRSGVGAVVEVGDKGGVAASFHLPAQRRVG
jgi:hypothetical protein